MTLEKYLIKTYIYDPTAPLAEEYKDFWVTAVESTVQHLAVHPFGFPDVTWITELSDDGAPTWDMDDYSCFAGGNFLLGGSYLDRSDFIELGLAFADSCHRLYNTTDSGLNPLSIAWFGPNNTATNPAYNGNTATAQEARSFYEAAGGYFIDFESAFATLYTLYPEPIESMYYAYRITGDPKWQDYNWEVFQAIKMDAERGNVVVSSLDDVTQPNGGGEWPDVPRYVMAQMKVIMESSQNGDIYFTAYGGAC
jgi:mannosyl-oligosaccharide alpha-1,2-mannosidase